MNRDILPHGATPPRHNLGESREEFLRPNGGRAHGLWSSHGGGNCCPNPVPPHFRNPNRTPDRIHDARRQSSAKRHGGARSAARWRATNSHGADRRAHALPSSSRSAHGSEAALLPDEVAT